MGNRTQLSNSSVNVLEAHRGYIRRGNSQITSDITKKKSLLKTSLYRFVNDNSFLCFSHCSDSHKPSLIEANLSLQLSTVCLLHDSTSNLYGLTFRCDSSKKFQVTVYYFIKEITDYSENIQYFAIDNNRNPIPTRLDFPAGVNQLVLTPKTIDLLSYSQNQDKLIIPIVIHIESTTEEGLYYYKLEASRIIKIRESHCFGPKVYEIFEIYSKEADECVVCMTTSCNIMAFPCLHVCCCEKCFTILNNRQAKCPICRAQLLDMYVLPKSLIFSQSIDERFI